jgi:putative tryptophan/tyrosine transport system substrate-binding protein
MKRRILVTTGIAALGGTATTWPAFGQAQQPARLAWIEPGAAATSTKYVAALRGGLTDNGLVEGRDYLLEMFFADGDYRRFPALTQAALARSPAILLVVTIASVRAAQQATKTVPIVFMSTNDPVGAGLIDSLARPGGNTTGVATMGDDTATKLVELVQSILPNARRLAMLINPLNATNRPIFEKVRAAGSTVGLDVRAIEVSAPEGLAAAFGSPAAARPDALLVGLDALLIQLASQIAALGLDRRIAVLGPSREQTVAGGLLSYGPLASDLVRRSAYYVKRILAGAKPADLPVEQPTRFELVINLNTAKAIDLTLPPALLARADEVIE